MNQILYGFHLIIGRFDIYRPNVPSLLAQKVLNLVLMIYTISFIIFFTVVLKYIGIKNVLEYKWWFLIVAFLLTCIEDYILFEKDKKAIKYFQEFLLLNSSSDIKWKVIAIVFSLGALVCLYFSIILITGISSNHFSY